MSKSGVGKWLKQVVQKKITRLVNINFNGTLSSNGRLVVRKITNDGTEATRVADSQGRSTTADLNADGSIHHSIKGIAPHGETDNLIPCNILVEHLNMNGEKWGTPKNRTGEEDGVDCVACNGTQELRMQVTRVARQEVWRELATSGSTKKHTTVLNLVNDLREAVRKKEALSTEQRKRITLVLDAVDFPNYTYPHVVESFRKSYGVEVQGLCFKAIWLAGPLAEMTARLDL
jgi:hypothetical protein